MTIRSATERADQQRERARIAAIEAMRLMLRGLEVELSGTRLEGLPKLGKSSTVPYRGIPVRAIREKNYILHRPSDGKDYGPASLCLTEEGRLVMARQDQSGRVVEQPAILESLRAEDVEHLAETIQEAIALHFEASGRREERYAELERLAERIRLSLDFDSALGGTKPLTPVMRRS